MKLSIFQRSALTADVRSQLYLSLAKVSSENLPVFNALEKMGASFTRFKHPVGPLIIYLLLRLRGAGVSHPGARRRTLGSELIGVVPVEEAMMIQAGEDRGNVAIGLQNAVNLIESKRKVQTALIEALRKPVGYLLGLMALLVYLSTSLLPAFEKSSSRAAWPQSAQLLATVADNAVLIAGGIGAFLLLSATAIAWVLPRWTGPVRAYFDRNVFPFGVVASIKGASFLTTLSGYVGAGIPIVRAVENIASTTTPYLRDQCTLFLDAMKRGKRPEQALCSLSIIPVKYHWIIDVYSMSPKAEVVYRSIADEVEKNVLEVVKVVFGSVVSNLMLAGIALMAFWIYASMAGIAMGGNPAM